MGDVVVLTVPEQKHPGESLMMLLLLVIMTGKRANKIRIGYAFGSKGTCHLLIFFVLRKLEHS